jgi:NADPH2:quinone reductase
MAERNEVMKMRAVFITTHGGPEVLEVREVPMSPAPPADRIRIRVFAAALNRADILQRMGRYPAPPGFPQEIPGLEFAGEIDEVGPEVRLWKPGQRVFGITGGAAQAEYVVVPESTVAAIPETLDWVAAAAVPEAFITAHDAMFTRAGLTIGDNVLIHAIGSGVGLAASQLANAAGAKVFGTSRTADKLARAKEFGMSEAVIAESDPQSIVDPIKDATGGKGINVLIDLVGAAYLNANLQVLAPLGRMIQVGTTSGSRTEIDLSMLMSKRATITGTVLRARSIEEKSIATRLFAQHVVPLLASGAVKPVVDSVYDIDQAGAAHKRVESNENFGKVVLRFRN